MSKRSTATRAASVERLIPRAPLDVLPLRASFAAMVEAQWVRYVPRALGDAPLGSGPEHAAKVRFLAGMYGRACYSMLLVSAHSPPILRLPIGIAASLPMSRWAAIRCGCSLLSFLDQLVSSSIHRQLALMATLMGVMDVVLDQVAPEGLASVLRIASMLSDRLSDRPPATAAPQEVTLQTLARSLRATESEWQTGYWDNVLLPAAREYCAAEALAVSNVPDPTGLGHRSAGIEAAIKGMWYVVGPSMGLGKAFDGFQQPHWNREQRWMADTSLLMQMIDDWVDQDEDRETRSTAVTAGAWGPRTIESLYERTTADLAALLNRNRIQNQVCRDLFRDLYTDYLHTALEAMQSGLAA